jgi:integrase
MAMKTQEALTRFLKKCEERGLAPETRRKYWSYLRHFVDEHPELPTDTKTIEAFLKKRKETPAHRGDVFKCVQTFYSYLEQFEEIKSPVPPRGPMGRPRKVKLVTNPAAVELDDFSTLKNEKVVQGGHSVSSSTSISTVDAVKAFIKNREIQGVSKRTLEGYPSRFKPFIGRYPMLPTTTEEIEDFLGSLKVDPETKWSYNKDLKALYHFLEERKGIQLTNRPGAFPNKNLITFPLVKFPRKVRRVLTIEELRQLFPFAENFKEKAILILLIDSKVRATELLSLDREKVYPDHITVTGKTGERDVPINPETYGILVQLALSGPLFTVNGKRMRREFLRIIVRRLMERAGLSGEKLGPHILRHSASVQHMMHGGDLLSLQEELGHTTPRQTAKYGKLAFPQVKQRHQEVNVLGSIVDQSDMEANLERAVCYGCHQQIVIAWLDVKETECPDCHQVGKWYLPNHRTEGVNLHPTEENNSYQGGSDE